MELKELQQEAIDLLKKLISTPSFSGEEGETASLLEDWFSHRGIAWKRQDNNVWALNRHFDPVKPTLLMNSHHDTVKPNSGYSRDPFVPDIMEGKLYGLGSNDAGGCLVSLLAAFTWLYERNDLGYNLLFAGTAEEEVNGSHGIASVLSSFPEIEAAIVGEPTLMKMAVAEMGLVVFDAVVKGTPSHAAHPNSDNPIYKSAKVLQWFENLTFDRVSEELGAVKPTVTQIRAGEQHNVVPGQVEMVIDVRVNERYTNAEIQKILQDSAPVDHIQARSLRLGSSSIPLDHPLVKAGYTLGMESYGSPTLSDQAMLNCPSLKLGPGDSRRSHSADEFIYVAEIESGIEGYIRLLESAFSDYNTNSKKDRI